MSTPSSSSDPTTGIAPAVSAPGSKALDAVRIRELNEKYRPLPVEERIARLYEDFDREDIMLTSSFAATSAYFLHLFSRIAPWQKIYFIDTGFHFPETLAYRKRLAELYHLNVVDIRAEDWKHEFTIKDETYKKDPDLCCSINKVEPLFEIKDNYRIWASGLMRWQTEHRATLDVFEERNGIVKFYPLIDVTREERDRYIEEHRLPFHPLVAKGYSSIGCKHCTVPGDDRSGRWNNCPKTECGLHL